MKLEKKMDKCSFSIVSDDIVFDIVGEVSSLAIEIPELLDVFTHVAIYANDRLQKVIKLKEGVLQTRVLLDNIQDEYSRDTRRNGVEKVNYYLMYQQIEEYI